MLVEAPPSQRLRTRLAAVAARITHDPAPAVPAKVTPDWASVLERIERAAEAAERLAFDEAKAL